MSLSKRSIICLPRLRLILPHGRGWPHAVYYCQDATGRPPLVADVRDESEASGSLWQLLTRPSRTQYSLAARLVYAYVLYTVGICLRQ